MEDYENKIWKQSFEWIKANFYIIRMDWFCEEWSLRKAYGKTQTTCNVSALNAQKGFWTRFWNFGHCVVNFAWWTLRPASTTGGYWRLRSLQRGDERRRIQLWPQFPTFVLNIVGTFAFYIRKIMLRIHKTINPSTSFYHFQLINDIYLNIQSYFTLIWAKKGLIIFGRILEVPANSRRIQHKNFLLSFHPVPCWRLFRTDTSII